MELREYQKDLINNIRKEIIKEKRAICAVLGCGGGCEEKIQGLVRRAPKGTVPAD